MQKKMAKSYFGNNAYGTDLATQTYSVVTDQRLSWKVKENALGLWHLDWSSIQTNKTEFLIQ